MVSETTQVTEPLAVSVDEVARRLGVGRTLLYDMIRQGKVRAVKLNTRTIIPVSEIDRILSGDAAA
jgi:excisionase family DNA binding protein